MVDGWSIHWPATGHCSSDAGGVNPTGVTVRIGLTTGPLGGLAWLAAPTSHCEGAPLEGGCWQKKSCEYPRSTVWPLSQASVNPMLMQLSPPSWHGSGLGDGLGDDAW